MKYITTQPLLSFATKTILKIRTYIYSSKKHKYNPFIPNDPFNFSIFKSVQRYDLLIEEHFYFILKNPLACTMSTDYLHDALINFHNSLLDRNKIKFVILILTLNKEYELLEIISKQKQLKAYYLNMFFNLELFAHIDDLAPHLLPNLINFQKNIYSDNHFFFNSFSSSRFENMASKMPLSKRNRIIKNIHTSFSNFLLDNQIMEDHIKISYLTHTFSFLLISLPSENDHLFISSILSTSTYFQQLFYHSITDAPQHLSRIIDAHSTTFNSTIHHTTISELFSSPILCSMAFKEGSPLFLPFCDVETHAKKHPELFAI